MKVILKKKKVRFIQVTMKFCDYLCNLFQCHCAKIYRKIAAAFLLKAVFNEEKFLLIQELFSFFI